MEQVDNQKYIPVDFLLKLHPSILSIAHKKKMSRNIIIIPVNSVLGIKRNHVWKPIQFRKVLLANYSLHYYQLYYYFRSSNYLYVRDISLSLCYVLLCLCCSTHHILPIKISHYQNILSTHRKPFRYISKPVSFSKWQVAC